MKRAISILLVLALFLSGTVFSDKAVSSTSTISLLGDVSGNGAVAADDALLVLHSITHQISLTELQQQLADVDDDGCITIHDALLILLWVTQTIQELPGNRPDVDESYVPSYIPVLSQKVEAESGQYPDTCHLVNHAQRTAIGFTSANNIYAYSLSIEQEGYYQLSYAMSAIRDVYLTVRVDGVDRLTLYPENTGDWKTYATNHSPSPLYLAPGDHAITFEQSQDGLNFDWFSLTYLSEGSPDQIPADRQMRAFFTNRVAQAGYRLPLTVEGLKDEDVIAHYVWCIEGEFTATTDLLAPTKTSIVKMNELAVWPVVRIEGKTYYLHTENTLSTPVASPLPIITINTDNEAEIISKEEYVGAQMSIEADGMKAEQLYAGTISIKGRGNSTWAYPKKPYKIKLNKKADLFGMGANKHWVLLANYRDRAFSRTALAFDLSEHLGLPTMQAVFVQVILNGQNVGVYQLCEHVRIGKTRIDITDWEDEVEDETDLSSLTSAGGYDTTGGFLIELNQYYDEVSKFKTEHDLPFTVKSPEYLNTNSEMFQYLTEYIQDFENAVYSDTFINSKGQHYSELFEVEDLVNYWLVNEFLGNLDSGRASSTYMYKDTGEDKFHMGPVWDFDSSIGNYHGHHTQCPADQWVKDKQGKWYTQLYRDRIFVKKLYDRYWENHGYLETLIDKAKDWYVVLYPYAVADHEYWNLPTSFTYDTQVVVDWLQVRLAFMDEQFASVDTAYASLNE